jgi:hypothetical protein
MKLIPLTQGHFAIVDDADFENVNQHKWSYHHTGYAMRQVRVRPGRGGQKNEWLHRRLMQPGEGLEVDHINHNKLDNRRANLRVCTKQQNRQNRKAYKGTSSGFKGVTWNTREQKWYVKISVNGQRKHIGVFDSAEDAARAYDVAAREHFGAFACLNFPSKDEQSA